MNRKNWGLGQIDYDQEWLSNLRFEMNLSRKSGTLTEGRYRVDSVAGLGANSVTFSATSPDGSPVAIKISIPRLAFYQGTARVDGYDSLARYSGNLAESDEARR